MSEHLDLIAADGMLPEAALAFSEPPLGVQVVAVGQAAPQKQIRYGFRIEALCFLINPDAGSEVIEIPSITAMPGALTGFLGLINLRSNLVPLFDMRTLLNMTAAAVNNMVLVFGQGKEAVAVMIKDAPEALAALQPLTALPPLPEVLRSHVHAGYMQDETVWLEFDHAAFFDEVCSA